MATEEEEEEEVEEEEEGEDFFVVFAEHAAQRTVAVAPLNPPSCWPSLARARELEEVCQRLT